MPFISIIFLFLIGLLSSASLSTVPAVQSDARDTERKSDISSIHVQLEVYFNEWGRYPTENDIATDLENTLPGLDVEAATDPSGDLIQQGDYQYNPSECTSIGCAQYEVFSALEDGSRYTKASLN